MPKGNKNGSFCIETVAAWGVAVEVRIKHRPCCSRRRSFSLNTKGYDNDDNENVVQL